MLTGRTVSLYSKDQHTSQTVARKIYIGEVARIGNKLMYCCRETETGKTFHADKAVYDRMFDFTPRAIRKPHYRELIGVAAKYR